MLKIRQKATGTLAIPVSDILHMADNTDQCMVATHIWDHVALGHLLYETELMPESAARLLDVTKAGSEYQNELLTVCAHQWQRETKGVFVSQGYVEPDPGVPPLSAGAEAEPGRIAADGDVPMSRPENLLEELKKAYAQWESLYKQGGSDPFYPDGVNLNLVRNHILYFKRQIEETQPLYKNTELFQRELPPQVEDGYMARAEEIRTHAKDTLTAYHADPYYQYLLHHREELEDTGLKKTSIRAVLNYAHSLETAIQEDDLVTMRRHERAEHYLDSFRACAEKVRDVLENQELNLFALAAQDDFPFPEEETASQTMTM